MIRVLLVDDEALARQALTLELSAAPDLEIVGECQNGVEAVQKVQELGPDLMFLDIQMPRLDGFDVLELLGDRAPLTVFVTAHDEYALRAFEAQAVDYLLKPVSAERLARCMERVRVELRAHQASTPPPPVVARLVENHQANQAPLARILVRLGTEVFVVPTVEISHIEAEDDCVRIHAAGRSYLKSERLNRLETLLDPRQFCRIHRSCLINVQFLKKIEPYSRDVHLAKLTGGETLPVSRAGFARLKGML